MLFLPICLYRPGYEPPAGSEPTFVSAATLAKQKQTAETKAQKPRPKKSEKDSASSFSRSGGGQRNPAWLTVSSGLEEKKLHRAIGGPMTT